jgi:hypothetical protein
LQRPSLSPLAAHRTDYRRWALRTKRAGQSDGEQVESAAATAIASASSNASPIAGPTRFSLVSFPTNADVDLLHDDTLYRGRARRRRGRPFLGASSSERSRLRCRRSARRWLNAWVSC